MVAVVDKRFTKDFQEYCEMLDLTAYEMDVLSHAIVYEVVGDPDNLYKAGVGIGIEIGEQRMYDAVWTIKDN